jgi:ABC-2 type transport system ATP-binding protein
MRMAEEAVRVHQLEKRYGSFVAVNRISFEVKRGEIFGFLGPNGAGKSTTIRMLCGILEPSGGSGWVDGLDLRTQTEQIKSRIGYMSQRFSLYEDLTVEENIDFFGGIYGLPAARRKERKEWVLEMADLVGQRRTRTGLLPAGWKQRLALGCALLHQPPILFLDEPTAGVDPLSRRRFWDLIYDLSARQVTVFITTHYLEEAEYCDRLALIHKGEVVACGPPHQLKALFLPEGVLEVRADKLPEILEEVERLPSVREVALFGDALRVMVKEAEAAAAEIGELLARRSSGPFRLERIAPTLEDVFVSLLQRMGGGQLPAAEEER